MARSRQIPDPRFAASPLAYRSGFNRHVRSGIGYDYWATSAQPAGGRRLGRRSAPLASNVLAPPGERPRYYTFAWQFLLWLAFAVLVLMMMFG